MSSLWRYFGLVGIIICLALTMVASMPSVEAAENSAAPVPNITADDMAADENVIYMGMWVINVYGFDYPTGGYVFDYYIYFFWSDPNITTVNWYMMNGKPSNPITKEMVSNGTEQGFDFEFYRVRADLSWPLEAGNYPFEPVVLPISIEVVNSQNPGNPYQLRWLQNSSGVDPGFKIVGWDVTDVQYTITPHEYPFVESPQATMDIVIKREMIVAFPDIILPPLIFCLVSAFSFLLRMDDSGAFGLRVGLNTSMLITAVLFNLSTQNQIPPTSTVNFYMIYITGVFIFLAINLIVTILGYVEYNYHKDPERLRRINRYGVIMSSIIPVIIVVTIILSLIAI
jgi:hypothetical protein